ncbi:MAG: YkvA family protein [Candidatus Pacearchaeota archaeon]|nr:YkvA family protein [Candidatus Pacearchaeota archaeon]
MVTLKKIKNSFKRYVKFYRVLTSDKRVPFFSKALLGFSLAYFVSPIDLIPDFIPVLGQIDDLILVPATAFIAIKFIPKNVYEENRRKVFG